MAPLLDIEDRKVNRMLLLHTITAIAAEFASMNACRMEFTYITSNASPY